jgi:hypothetical protein
MKKGLVLMVLAAVVVAGLIYGSHFMGFENMAQDPKPGV